MIFELEFSFVPKTIRKTEKRITIEMINELQKYPDNPPPPFTVSFIFAKDWQVLEPVVELDKQIVWIPIPKTNYLLDNSNFAGIQTLSNIKM